MRVSKASFFFLSVLMTGVPVIGTAMAQDPVAIIDARQAELKKAGDAMKALGGYAKGGDLSADVLKAHGATLAGVAKALPGWWPAGTAVGVSDSEALPAIWEKPDQFQARAVAFQTETAALEQAIAGGDRAAIAAQVGKVGGTCKACHQDFRE